MVDIRLKQYVYIAVESETLSCHEIEADLGIVADAHKVLGTRGHQLDPSRPIVNSWQLTHKENIAVDEQIEILINRLSPSKEQLIKLVNAKQVEVRLEVVRYFDHSKGEREFIDEEANFIKLPGQHQLLGWYISSANIAFLASIEADLDVDEYN